MSSLNYDGAVPASVYRDKKFVLIICVVLAVIALDLTMITGYGLLQKQFLTEFGKILFAIESVTILIAAVVLVSRIRPQFAARIAGGIDLRKFHRMTQITYYFLVAIVISIILELFFESFYGTLLLTEGIALSYGISICNLGIFVFRLAGALSTRRNSLVIVMFLATLATITFNASITVFSISLRISDWPPELRPAQSTGDVSRGRYNTLDDLYFFSNIASFVTAWGASATILSRYSHKLGGIKILLLQIGPLVFFLGQFAVPASGQLASVMHLDTFSVSVIVTTISSISKPVGGLMLAVVFWSMARAKETNAALKNSLMIAGLGFVMLFSSNQALLLSLLPFPPFGLPSITVMVVSSYLLVIGVYTSSISIATDANLRELVRNAAKSRLRLLESVVSPDIVRSIENESAEILRKESQRISAKTGLDPKLEDQEIRAYLEEVAGVIQEHQERLAHERNQKSQDKHSGTNAFD